MKVVALVSGGKDSCFNMVKCVQYGHEIAVLANLHPADTDSNEIDSYMYQTVGHNAIDAIAECMDLPLVRRPIHGGAVVQGMEYTETDKDEVEDLYELLLEVKKRFPEVQGVSCGAIFSDYQRARVENVCSRLSLTSLAFLWRRDQRELLQEMVDNNVNAVLIKVAAMGLESKHLGKSLAQLQLHFKSCHAKFGFNECGEGGEYETFTLDCPLFKKRIVIDSSEVVIHSDDAFAPVALLHISSYHTEAKEHVEGVALLSADEGALEATLAKDVLDIPRDDIPSMWQNVRVDRVDVGAPRSSLGAVDNSRHLITKCLPDDAKAVHGFISADSRGIKDVSEATSAVLEAIRVAIEPSTFALEDIVFVYAYLDSMGNFAEFNKVYSGFFKDLKAARACVESRTGALVMIEVCLSRTPRETVHVQSMSEWAPCMIGPYSQASRMENSLSMLAGNIGLYPPKMDFVSAKTVYQAMQAYRNTCKVKDVGSGTEIVDANVYIADNCHADAAPVLAVLRSAMPDALLSTVVVPVLPKHAAVELQAVCQSDVRNCRLSPLARHDTPVDAVEAWAQTVEVTRGNKERYYGLVAYLSPRADGGPDHGAMAAALRDIVSSRLDAISSRENRPADDSGDDDDTAVRSLTILRVNCSGAVDAEGLRDAIAAGGMAPSPSIVSVTDILFERAIDEIGRAHVSLQLGVLI